MHTLQFPDVTYTSSVQTTWLYRLGRQGGSQQNPRPDCLLMITAAMEKLANKIVNFAKH